MEKKTPAEAQPPQPVETHPFEPFLPEGARLLMLGTFPPSPRRWCMDFYYPNFQNDMWRIFGICYFADKDHFVLPGEKRFDLDRIVPFLRQEHIAIYDTAVKVRRTKNTASDKDLDIVQPTDVRSMLRQLPECRAVVTTGSLATEVFCTHFGIRPPKVGDYAEFALDRRPLRLYRMPSSSRAYPMKVEKKAEFYRPMFDYIRA